MNPETPKDKPSHRFFMILNPESPTPPRVRYTGRRMAAQEQLSLARRNPGQEFIRLAAEVSIRCVDGEIVEDAYGFSSDRLKGGDGRPHGAVYWREVARVAQSAAPPHTPDELRVLEIVLRGVPGQVFLEMGLHEAFITLRKRYCGEDAAILDEMEARAS
jgi:hypothetical protein